ncbi:hypothetical protein GCM10009675_46500 [Prauserella alba]|uniref:Uncharacterized protein n=1 Tax=Prauserella alba TaxID=176898 RepID=A0ABP4GCW1_9PSEU
MPHRLEAADRRAELVALARVARRELQCAFDDAELLRAVAEREAPPQERHRCGGQHRLRPDALRADERGVGVVDHALASEIQTGRIGGDQHEHVAVGHGRLDQHAVGERPVRHGLCLTAQPAHRVQGEPRGSAVVGHGCAHHRPAPHGGHEPAFQQFAAAELGQHRRRGSDRGHVRHGRDGSSQFVPDRALFQYAEAPTPDRRRQCRVQHAGGGQRPPQLAVEPAGPVRCRRRVVPGDPAGQLREVALRLGVGEIHRRLLARSDRQP